VNIRILSMKNSRFNSILVCKSLPRIGFEKSQLKIAIFPMEKLDEDLPNSGRNWLTVSLIIFGMFSLVKVF